MPSAKILINFFSQSDYIPIRNLSKLRHFLIDLINKENVIYYSGEINVVFCSDEYLMELNSKYLHKDYMTDVITFNYSEDDKFVGDIYISSERVKENAKNYSQKYHNELLRVVIHGFLHLCGYEDKKNREKLVMTEKENLYISIFEKILNTKLQKRNE